MSAQLLFSLSVLLLALALLLIGASLLQRAWRSSRSGKTVDHLIAVREHVERPPAETRMRDWKAALLAFGARWLESPLGQQLVAPEDRHVLDQCGINDAGGKVMFLFARIALAVALPVFVLLLFDGRNSVQSLCIAFGGFAVGCLLPKWGMRMVAAGRRRRIAEELPLMVDMLRLLQGVGLSIDQSLHVIQTEFDGTLKILCQELEIAAHQYRAGRTREQSLRRLATIYENDDIDALTRFIAQVEEHGGSVQEPLKQFSERLREKRKMEMKERVGQLTVKMTMVMVLTLLPALLTITGGGAFLAVIRALGKLAGKG